MRRDSGWWDEFFTSFRPVFDVIPLKSTNAQVRFIVKKLGLKPGMKFLDCPCGIGRIALPLARKGIQVTGVDFMGSYLDELQRKAKRRGLEIRTIQQDMRRVNFSNEYDVAANIWTSFGFFEKESDDVLTLRRMYQALKPGGKFMLSLINRDWVMANLKSRDWFLAGDVKVIQEQDFDYESSRSIGIWYFIKDGQERVHRMSLRVYSYHELVRMFKGVGFTGIEGFAGILEEPPSRERHMMTVIGRKPGRRVG